MSFETNLERFAQERCSAILRTAQADAVAPAMQAAVDGGFRIIEFTLNTPNALKHISEFAQDPQLLVGAGTVLSVTDAERAVAAGAQFVVSPVYDPQVVDWCTRQQIISIPGAYTPSEMLRAHRGGCTITKLFPGPADGPQFLKTCHGPLPFLRIFPTSGVTVDNCAEYLAAGAFGVGFVNCLFEPADMAAARFDVIRARAAQMIAAVSAAP